VVISRKFSETWRPRCGNSARLSATVANLPARRTAAFGLNNSIYSTISNRSDFARLVQTTRCKSVANLGRSEPFTCAPRSKPLFHSFVGNHSTCVSISNAFGIRIRLRLVIDDVENTGFMFHLHRLPYSYEPSNPSLSPLDPAHRFRRLGHVLPVPA
jgi:hypothetical protein